MLVPENRGRIAVGMLSLVLPVLLLWRCAARPEAQPAAATTVAPTPGAEGAATPQATAAQGARPTSGDSALAPTTSASVPLPVAALAPPSLSASSNTAAPIIAAVAQRDPRDLGLLSRIERELERDPPPAVHALIRMRESGASRSQLLAEADKQLATDVALRLMVRRWIDDVAPGGTAPPKTVGPASSAGHAPLIKPIQPARSR